MPVDPSENIRGGVVFIDQPDVIRAIRAVAPHAHIVILPSDILDRRMLAPTLPAHDLHADGKLETLTRRERAVLARVATGATNAEVADEMGLARNTVKAYLQSIMSKLGARNRVEASAYARKYGAM